MAAESLEVVSEALERAASAVDAVKQERNALLEELTTYRRALGLEADISERLVRGSKERPGTKPSSQEDFANFLPVPTPPVSPTTDSESTARRAYRTRSRSLLTSYVATIPGMFSETEQCAKASSMGMFMPSECSMDSELQGGSKPSAPGFDKKLAHRTVLAKYDGGRGYMDSNRLLQALMDKAPQENFSMDELDKVIQELKFVHSKMFPASRHVSFVKPGGISCDMLADLMCAADITKFVRTPGLKSCVTRVIAVLAMHTVDNIIDSSAHFAREEVSRRRSTEETSSISFRNPCATLDAWVSLVVSSAVIVNLICTGVSLDVDPDNPAWLAVEVICCSVFMFEVIFKLRRVGAREYFCGESRVWNIVDLVVTGMSTFDIAFGVQMYVTVGRDSKVSSATRLSLVLRALRLIRVLRIIKLAKSPVMQDLANMVIGCVVGLPSLFWVLMLFMLILYMTGMVFRIVFGRNGYIEACGMMPDDVPLPAPDNCPIHYMYGEEFFGTVPGAMFSAFRFMLGDWTSFGGRSVLLSFEQGYGTIFRIPFVIWMVVVIFGMFNVITAVFVDATSTGLKHTGMKRKFARVYERRYVKQKLKALMTRLKEVMKLTEPPARRTSKHSQQGLNEDVGLAAKTLRLEQFLDFLADDEFKSILQELDVDVWDPVGLFETCDTMSTGEVTVEEFIQGILKLRGEPQKCDIIATFNAIRSVQRQLDEITAHNGTVAVAPSERSARNHRTASTLL